MYVYTTHTPGLTRLRCCYRYHDFWRFVTQRLSFLSSLLVYLESGDLATHSQVADMLGSKSRKSQISGLLCIALCVYVCIIEPN